jgi:hypothetical protein
VFHGLDAPTDVDSASNKQIIISRDGPKNRDSRKFNRINDLRKLIIEEIKDHQLDCRSSTSTATAGMGNYACAITTPLIQPNMV